MYGLTNNFLYKENKDTYILNSSSTSAWYRNFGDISDLQQSILNNSFSIIFYGNKSIKLIVKLLIRKLNLIFCTTKHIVRQCTFLNCTVANTILTNYFFIQFHNSIFCTCKTLNKYCVMKGIYCSFVITFSESLDKGYQDKV